MAPVNFKPLTLDPVSFSLTDGTNIPPPPPSPPPVASPTPTTPPLKAAAPPAPKQLFAPQSPTSPTGKRPSSVRKLLSLRSLKDKDNRSSIYGLPNANGKISTDSHSPSYLSRPGSPYTVNSDGSTTPSLNRKRSSGWFGSRRKSTLFGNGHVEESVNGHGGAVQPAMPTRKGPPPPKLPELREFGSLNGALNESLNADELFKDIK